MIKDDWWLKKRMQTNGIFYKIKSRIIHEAKEIPPVAMRILIHQPYLWAQSGFKEPFFPTMLPTAVTSSLSSAPCSHVAPENKQGSTSVLSDAVVSFTQSKTWRDCSDLLLNTGDNEMHNNKKKRSLKMNWSEKGRKENDISFQFWDDFISDSSWDSFEY